MPKKLKYSFIKKQLKLQGFILLSKKYINSTKKLKCLCKNGHIFCIRWGDFQQGHACPRCYGNAPPTYNYVKNFFESKGCILLSKKYVRSSEKLDYICKNKHNHSIRWDDFKKGLGCPKCRSIYSPKGSEHWNWQGGLSVEPYCLIWADNIYKKAIKDRDSNMCQNPYCFKIVYSRALSIHHIDYNKKNCHPSNLITLCIGCNSRANKDRDWHTEWYQTLMHNKYGYINE